jgi:hypothetical protein
MSTDEAKVPLSLVPSPRVDVLSWDHERARMILEDWGETALSRVAMGTLRVRAPGERPVRRALETRNGMRHRVGGAGGTTRRGGTGAR